MENFKHIIASSIPFGPIEMTEDLMQQASKLPIKNFTTGEIVVIIGIGFMAGMIFQKIFVERKNNNVSASDTKRASVPKTSDSKADTSEIDNNA